MNLMELSDATGISKSALGDYENIDYKEINHGNLVTLAKVLRGVHGLSALYDGEQKSPKHGAYRTAFE